MWEDREKTVILEKTIKETLMVAGMMVEEEQTKKLGAIMKDGITVDDADLEEAVAGAIYNAMESVSYLLLEGKAATLPMSHTTVPARLREAQEEELLL